MHLVMGLVAVIKDLCGADLQHAVLPVPLCLTWGDATLLEHHLLLNQ